MSNTFHLAPSGIIPDCTDEFMAGICDVFDITVIERASTGPLNCDIEVPGLLQIINNIENFIFWEFRDKLANLV